MLGPTYSARLYNLSIIQFYVAVLVLSLFCSVFFFSPSFVAWDLTQSDHFETARTFSLRKQLEDPFRRDIEPSLYWRLLVPVVARAAHIPLALVLILPAIGLVMHLLLVCYLVLHFTRNREYAFWATLLTASFASTWITTGFLGVFIIYPVLALTCVSFLRDKRVLYPIAFAAPWMSEYYIIGLPVALCARYVVYRERVDIPEVLKLLSPGLLLYGLVRVITTILYPEYDANGWRFLMSSMRNTVWYLPFAPLAWWFAYRLGWIYIWNAVVSLQTSSRIIQIAAFSALLLTLTAVTLFGSAMTANIMVFFPLFLAGFLVTKDYFHDRYLMLVAVLNYVVPAAYVDFVKFKIKSPLLIEISRLFF